MVWKKIFFGFVSLFFIFSILIYWFLPFSEINFNVDKNPEFSVGNISAEMQFYKNMRFPNSKISYKIEDDCSLKKSSEMVKAFNRIEELTLIDFYPVNSGEEITVSCEEKAKTSEGGLFIAGEGGPTKISSGENFNVIFSGQILLLRDSSCERPNVGIHELLHVLGFDHSENKNNIMYTVSKCSQTIGDEIVDKINKLYEFPSYPDLKVENISAEINGRYLSLNLSIKNIGLKDSLSGKLFIYGSEEKIKEMDLGEIKIGYGLEVILVNIWLKERKIEKLKIVVESNDTELSLENNQIILTKLSS